MIAASIRETQTLKESSLSFLSSSSVIRSLANLIGSGILAADEEDFTEANLITQAIGIDQL